MKRPVLIPNAPTGRLFVNGHRVHASNSSMGSRGKGSHRPVCIKTAAIAVIYIVSLM